MAPAGRHPTDVVRVTRVLPGTLGPTPVRCRADAITGWYRCRLARRKFSVTSPRHARMRPSDVTQPSATFAGWHPRDVTASHAMMSDGCHYGTRGMSWHPHWGKPVASVGSRLRMPCRCHGCRSCAGFGASHRTENSTKCNHPTRLSKPRRAGASEDFQ
jgi:hypothetical protein